MEQMTLDTRLAQTDLGVNKGLPEMYGVAPWDFHGQDYHRHEFLRSLVMLSHMEGPGRHPRAGLTPVNCVKRFQKFSLSCPLCSPLCMGTQRTLEQEATAKDTEGS